MYNLMERLFNDRKTKSMPICTCFLHTEIPLTQWKCHIEAFIWRWRRLLPPPPYCGPEGITGDKAPRFPYNWHVKVVILSALCTVHLYPPNIFLVLISFGVLIDPRAIVCLPARLSIRNFNATIWNRFRKRCIYTLYTGNIFTTGPYFH